MHYQILFSMNKGIKRARIHIYEGHIYDGEYFPERLKDSIEFEYDQEGWMLSRIYFSYNEKDGTEIRVDEYITKRRVENGFVIYEEFDSNGKSLGYDKFDSDGRCLESLWPSGQKFYNIYDDKGNEVEEYSLDKDGKLLYRVRYEYDTDNKMIRSFHENDEPCSCQHYYSKDVMGNIVTTTHNDINDHVDSSVKEGNHRDAFEDKEERYEDKYTTSVRFFDKKGNQCYYLSWSEDDLIDSCRMTYFKYDERGNWIMRIEPPLINLEVTELGCSILKCTIAVREIEYHSDDNGPF